MFRMYLSPPSPVYLISMKQPTYFFFKWFTKLFVFFPIRLQEEKNNHAFWSWLSVLFLLRLYVYLSMEETMVETSEWNIWKKASGPIFIGFMSRKRNLINERSINLKRLKQKEKNRRKHHRNRPIWENAKMIGFQFTRLSSCVGISE